MKRIHLIRSVLLALIVVFSVPISLLWAESGHLIPILPIVSVSNMRAIDKNSVAHTSGPDHPKILFIAHGEPAP